MTNMNDLTERAIAHGFSHAAPLDVATIELLPEVRDMCASNKCGAYNACWTCPPACGDLDACRERLNGFTRGLVVQTVGQLEDSMDFETMQDTADRHRELFISFGDALRGEYGRILALGAGGCRICEKCAYPDAPCRFPERAFSSMEGYGMLVTDVCRKNGLSYYYGPNTIAYTACYLID